MQTIIDSLLQIDEKAECQYVEFTFNFPLARKPTLSAGVLV